MAKANYIKIAKKAATTQISELRKVRFKWYAQKGFFAKKSKNRFFFASDDCGSECVRKFRS